VFLRIKADDERGHVDDLLPDADMSLSDEDAGVVYALGETGFEDLCLEAAFEEIFDLEREDVVETHAGLVEDADADEAADEGVAFEEALWVLVVEFEKFAGCAADFGEG